MADESRPDSDSRTQGRTADWANEAALSELSEVMREFRNVGGVLGDLSQRAVEIVDRVGRGNFGGPEGGQKTRHEREREVQYRRTGRAMDESGRAMEELGYRVRDVSDSFMHADESLKSWSGAVLKFAGAPAALTGATLAVASAFDQIAEFQQEAYQTGFHLMGGIQDFRTDITGINVGMEGLTDIIRSEGEAIRFMGESSAVATASMLGMGQEAHSAAKKFGFFGKHASEMLIETMETASLMVLTGATRDQVEREAAMVTVRMNREAANLANLTGMSQREIMAAGTSVREDSLLMATLDKLGLGQAGWRSMAQMGTSLLGDGWEEGGPIQEFIKGELIRRVQNVETPEGAEARGQVQVAVGGYSAYGDLMKVVDQIMSGDTGGTAEAFQRIARGWLGADTTHATALGMEEPIVKAMMDARATERVRTLAAIDDISARIGGDMKQDSDAMQRSAMAGQMRMLMDQAGKQLRASIMNIFGFEKEWYDGKGNQEAIADKMKEYETMIKESVEMAKEIGRNVRDGLEWIHWAVTGFYGWVQGWTHGFTNLFSSEEDSESASAASNIIAGGITAFAVGLAGKWALGLASLPFKAAAFVANWAAVNAIKVAAIAARGLKLAAFWALGLKGLPLAKGAMVGIAAGATAMTGGITGYASRAFSAAKGMIGKINPAPAARFAMRGLMSLGKFTGIGTALWGLYGGAMGLMDEEFREAGLGVVQRMIGGLVQKLVFGTMDFFGNILLAPVNWLFGTDFKLNTEGWFKDAYITLMEGVNDIYDACVDWIVDKIKGFFSWGLDLVKKIPIVGKLFGEDGDGSPASAPSAGSGHSPGPFATTHQVIDAAKKQGADLASGGTPLFSSAPVMGGPLADITRAAVGAHIAAKEKESDAIIKSVDGLKGAIDSVERRIQEGNAQRGAIKSEVRKQTGFMDEAR